MNLVNMEVACEILEDPAEFSEQYAEAAIASNPDIMWMKFIFTDDQPNANKQRVPKEEFSNIVKSGVYMPVKMEGDNPDGNHPLSTPVGTITNLMHPKDSNKVVGLAALWKRERPEGLSAIENKFKDGEIPTLSWELFYQESSLDENGVEDLKGTNVRGITFVRNPAYEGRTNALSVSQANAAQNEDTETESVESENDDTNKENEKLEELKELQNRIEELENQLEAKSAELDTLNKEKEDLQTWRDEREAEDAKAALVDNRRKMLVESGIEFTDEEWQARSERLLAMDDTTYEFYVQDLVAFSEKNNEEEEEEGESNASASNPAIPSVANSGEKDAISILREAFLKENRGDNE